MVNGWEKSLAPILDPPFFLFIYLLRAHLASKKNEENGIFISIPTLGNGEKS